MSRCRPESGPTISLFPFLAVLLCMMGGLLVLLVIFSRAAVSSARAAVTAAVADLEIARETAAWRVQQLEGVRDRTATDLASARLQLAGAEEHARELADELDRMVATVQALAKPADDRAGAAVAALEARLKSARESIDQQRADAAQRPPAYAVVPYVGVNGTHRRPLYIECGIDGVFLQPEGIRLGPADFEGPPGPGNPLASALRAAREQMARTASNPGDPAQQPYPLLLVRPSGVMAYYAAREAIASWGSEFGYQLVDEDWTLAFPPADPAIRDVELRAVEESRRRLAWLAEVRPPKPVAKQPLYRAATTRGGVVAEGGPTVLGDQSRWNWTEEQAASGNAAGVGRATAGFPGAGGNGSGSGTGTAGDGPGGAGPTGPGRPLLAAGDESVGSGGDPILAARGGRGGAGPGAVRASDTSGSAGPPGSGAGSGAGGSATSQPGGTAAAGSAAGAPGAPGVPGGDRYAGASAFSDGGGVGGTAGQAGGGGAASGGGPVSMASSAGGGGASAGAAGASGGQPLPGMLTTGGSAAGASASAGAAGASVSLSGARGSNWASFASRERPIPITRPVRIECAADEFRILEDGNRRIETRVPVPAATADAVDSLVEALRGKVARWGLAGDRMYWKPQLVLTAAAGGQGRRDDLQRLLVDSGLETTTDARDDEIRNLPPVSRPGYAVKTP
ncbi:MAG: hypothetical protein EBR86_04085 [Planctomycetia bacterium]|nr:hypothetical protein [Planctomycetia bacterium]